MSKFDGLFSARGDGKGREKEKGSDSTKGKSRAKLAIEERPRRGRPSGKRSDPDYVGFTTYIRKETHRNVKRALLDEPDERELSELVEDLLVDWLKSQARR